MSVLRKIERLLGLYRQPPCESCEHWVPNKAGPFCAAGLGPGSTAMMREAAATGMCDKWEDFWENWPEDDDDDEA